MDLRNSVIIPREDFVELQEVAFNQPLPSVSERALMTAQSLTVTGGIAAIFVVATWAWASVMDKKDERKYKREIELDKQRKNNTAMANGLTSMDQTKIRN